MKKNMTDVSGKRGYRKFGEVARRSGEVPAAAGGEDRVREQAGRYFACKEGSK